MVNAYKTGWLQGLSPGTRENYGQVLSRFADFCDAKHQDYAVYPLDKVADFVKLTWSDVQRKNGTNPGQTMEHTRKALKAAMLCQYGNPCTEEEWKRYSSIHGPVSDAQHLTKQLRAR